MDELCQRRQYWKDRYVEWVNNSIELCNDDIESSLHDTWSEVRYDSFKSLKKLQEHISPQKLLELGRRLLLKIDGLTYSWQILHGSILGLKAICYFLIRFDTDERDTFHNDVIKSCLSIVTHDMLPIREATRECIIEYLKVLASYSNNYHKYCDFTMLVLSSLKTLSKEKFQDEKFASSFDGLLGCLVDIIQHSKFGLQIFNYFDNKEYAETSDLIFLHNQNLFLKCTITCFNHEASTVRQRAASVLLSLFKLNNDYNEVKKKIQDDLLIVLQEIVAHCINENHKDHWKILETCLIISEDVITSEIQFFFNALKTNSDNGKELMQSVSLLKVLSCLRRSMPFTILNSQFELRRMGSQLLPTLARATILFDVHNIFDEALINSIDSENSSKKLLLTSCVWCGWTSEITKAIQYLLEYFVPPDIYSLALKSCTPLKETFMYTGLGIWANKVRGRLNEEETRLSYNSGLQDVKNSGNVSLTDLMINSMKRLSLLHKYVIEASSQKLFSVDFCEASILTFTVLTWNWNLVSSKDHGPSTVPKNHSSTVPYDSFKLAISQLLELEFLSTSLDASSQLQSLIEWLETKTNHDENGHYQIYRLADKSLASAEYRIDDVALMSSITDPMVPLCDYSSAPSSPKNGLGAISPYGSSSYGTYPNICRRWVCEAISPVLPTLAVLIGGKIDIVVLAVIVSLWIEDICVDGLWFDRKILAKRSLIESLPILIDNAVNYMLTADDDHVKIIDILISTLKVTLLKTTELDNQDLYYIFQSCRILTEYLLNFKQKLKHNNEEIYDNMINKIQDIIKYYVSKYPFINLSNSDDKNEGIWTFNNSNIVNKEILEEDNIVNKEILEEDEFSDWDADTNDNESDNEKSVSISKDINSKTLKEIQDIISLLD